MSDAEVSNLRNSVENMVSRGMEARKFTWIPNGFSRDEISESIALTKSADNQLPDNQFVVGYVGTIGRANALRNLVNAAERLKDNQDISFVFVGDGREKPVLERIASDKGLTNIRFFGPIPKAQVHEMIQKFSICYIGWVDSDLYRFGIAANKIFDYMCAGKPIVHAYSGACDPVIEAKAGLGVPAEDSESLAMAIQQFYKMVPEEPAQFSVNGKKVAVSNHQYYKLSIQLANVLFAND
jgi:glycosyltransferase involved in cell wall biosynthesis